MVSRKRYYQSLKRVSTKMPIDRLIIVNCMNWLTCNYTIVKFQIR